LTVLNISKFEKSEIKTMTVLKVSHH